MDMSRVNTAQRSKPFPLVAPVGGLNGRDALSAMDPLDAYVMENMFPTTTSVDVRSGCELHVATPDNLPVMSMATYSGSTMPYQVLAWTGAKMLNVTNPAAIITLSSSFANNDVVTTMFATAADSAQCMVITTDGDPPKKYDGTTLSDLAFTGTPIPGGNNNINFVCPYQSRLFFGAKNRMGFAYLAPGTVGGDIKWFDLGQVAHRGGKLQAIATFSDADAGDGPNEYIVFISDRGEYIVYSGIDPGSATNWQLVGRYTSAEPIGRKCVCDFNGELLVLTTEGALQFSQIRRHNDTRSDLIALSSKLGDILLKHKDYRTAPGWSMILYPSGGWLIVTAPNTTSTSGEYCHYVMNTVTQAWTKFTSKKWNGLSWTVANMRLYYGRYDGKVMRADVGAYDDGEQIPFVCKQAYTMCQVPTDKQFKWAAMLMQSDAPILVTVNLNVDFYDTRESTLPLPAPGTEGAKWDVVFWDQEYWAQGPYTQEIVQAFNSWGTYGSLYVKGAVAGATFKWFSTKLITEASTGLLT